MKMRTIIRTFPDDQWIISPHCSWQIQPFRLSNSRTIRALLQFVRQMLVIDHQRFANSLLLHRPYLHMPLNQMAAYTFPIHLRFNIKRRLNGIIIRHKNKSTADVCVQEIKFFSVFTHTHTRFLCVHRLDFEVISDKSIGGYGKSIDEMREKT